MKEIRFKLGDSVITASLDSKVDKKALYGYAKRVVEKEGRVLSKGILCPDGRLLQRDEVTPAYMDPEGTPIEELMTEIDGKAVSFQPSSFDQENVLEPVPLQALIGFNTGDVYPIENTGLSPGLYRTRFSYRKALQPREALVLVKEKEAYLLVGRRKNTAFLGLNVAYEFFDAEGEATEESEELDFSMV